MLAEEGDTMSNEYDRAVGELLSLAKETHDRRPPRRKAIGVWTKVFVVAAVMVAVASAALAAVVLFTQTPTYTSVAVLTSGCSSPTGTPNGTLIIFACPTLAALSVSSTASGFVRYTSYTVPSNITDVWLVDTRAAANSTCSGWTSTGATNMPLQVVGGQITIGTTAGRMAPGHSYDYCADYSSAPPSFSFSVTWSQG